MNNRSRKTLLLVLLGALAFAGAATGSSCAADASGRIVARADHGSDILYVDFPLDESGRLFGAPPVEAVAPLRD